jgi:hypothetical protein
MGSNSNPSEDNLDEEEVYKNVYGLNNAKEFMESRKIKEAEFIEKLEMGNLSQADLLANLKGKKKDD